MEYDPTQFVDTAPYYLSGRPPYSADLGSVLTEAVHGLLEPPRSAAPTSYTPLRRCSATASTPSSSTCAPS